MATINQLKELISKLQRERQTHIEALAEIDAAFEQLGQATRQPAKRGRRPGRPKKVGGKTKATGKKRRKRRSFKVSGSDLVLGMIKRGGAKGATSAEISKGWKAADRAGDVYNTLTVLGKEKKIKRHVVAGQRGSRYTLA